MMRHNEKRSDEGRCHDRPFAELTYSAALEYCSLPVNCGMRLEAIAALLGYRKMEMTLIYAKIANRVVARLVVDASAEQLPRPEPLAELATAAQRIAHHGRVLDDRTGIAATQPERLEREPE